MKSWIKEKTTIISVIGAIGFIVLLILLIAKVIDGLQFAAAIGGWAGGVATLIGAFAQDRKNTP